MKLLKLLTFSLLLMTLAAACNKNQKENDVQIENPEEAIKHIDSELYALISGKWQLVEVREVFVPVPPHPSYDYSGYNIVYEFKTNGVLTVSGETYDIDRYIGHEIGEHPYSFIDDDRGLGMPNLPFGLQIDNFPYWYQISSEELKIDYSPGDGYIYFLIKLN